MSQKRIRRASKKTNRRWLFSGVLLLVLIAVGGFFLGRSSLIPMVSNALKQAQPSVNTQPTPTAQAVVAKQTELESQAKGYELVLQRKPDDRTALEGLIQTKLELARLGAGSIKDTLEPMEKLAQQNPKETKYTILLAQTKQHTGDLEGAATAYRSILESNPGDVNALDGLVSLLLDQKRPEAAIGLLQDTLDNAPKLNQIKYGTIDEVSVHIMLGRVYAEQERYPDAIAAYDKAMKANKEDFRPLLAKAIVLQKQGKNEEAQPLFSSSASLAPSQYKDQIIQLASASPSPQAAETPNSTPQADGEENPDANDSQAVN